MPKDLPPLKPLGDPRESLVLLHTKILLYYDGPLELDSYEVTSHDHESKEIDTGQRFICIWYDEDNDHTRWILFRVTDEMMDQYYAGKFSLRDVWLSQTTIIVRTIEDFTGMSVWTEAPLADFPEDSISMEDSFYEEDEYFPEMMPLLDENDEALPQLIQVTHLCAT